MFGLLWSTSWLNYPSSLPMGVNILFFYTAVFNINFKFPIQKPTPETIREINIKMDRQNTERKDME
jgi:hypothetical protein